MYVFEIYSFFCNVMAVIGSNECILNLFFHLQCVFISRDWGYLGCYTDVMLLADRWCSGRRSCQIPIPNGAFKAVISCPSDLLNYFEASFSCVKGILL